MPKAYYQEDLVGEIITRFKTAPAFTKATVRVALDCWRRAILRGDEVHLTGIGVLYADPVEAHDTHVPSGRMVHVPAYRRMKLRVSDPLRQELRGVPDASKS